MTESILIKKYVAKGLSYIIPYFFLNRYTLMIHIKTKRILVSYMQGSIEMCLNEITHSQIYLNENTHSFSYEIMSQNLNSSHIFYRKS